MPSGNGLQTSLFDLMGHVSLKSVLIAILFNLTTRTNFEIEAVERDLESPRFSSPRLIIHLVKCSLQPLVSAGC